MDEIDREILALMQEDGRMSATELASKVGLSLSACHRRLKDLETSGAIRGYRAIISPEAVGLTFESIIFVTIAHTSLEVISAFEEAVEKVPNIVEAQRLFGEPDYILRVLTKDLTAYQEFYDATLSKLPGVQTLRSTLVMKQISADRIVPTSEH